MLYYISPYSNQLFWYHKTSRPQTASQHVRACYRPVSLQDPSQGLSFPLQELARRGERGTAYRCIPPEQGASIGKRVPSGFVSIVSMLRAPELISLIGCIMGAA
jgi:hypothetical protein